MTHSAGTGLLTRNSADSYRPRSASSMHSALFNCARTTHFNGVGEMSERRSAPGLRPIFSIPQQLDLEAGKTYSGFCNVQRGLFSSSIMSTREPIDFESAEAKNTMKVLEKLFLPIVMRRVLRWRKSKRSPKDNEPRIYSCESIVDAIRSSNSILASWPVEMLKAFAAEATYFYLEPNEIIVHENEQYVSCGVIVLLYGELIESRRYYSSTLHRSSCFVGQFGAPEVLCDRVVLCRDVSISTFRARDYTDLAFIPARWVWDVINSGIEQLPEASESVLECIRATIVPMTRKLIDDRYYPTPLVLRRSWFWPLLGTGDRAKLARVMDTRVLCIGDKLYSEGDRDPYMYIIRRGTVTVSVQKEPFCTVETGNAFGEISILFNDPRCSTVVATSMCEVYCLHRDHLLKRMRKKEGLCSAIVARALERRRQWLEAGKESDWMGLATLLAGVSCLSQTTEKIRMELARGATVHVIPPREKLFAKGELCDRLFVIGRGSLALCDGDYTHNVRTTTGFVGELCLHPHRWPYDVVTLTSVDGWSLSAEKIIQTLSTIRAEAQAVTICRQGIELYRAHHGTDSVVEEPNFCVSPTTPSCATPPGGPGKESISATPTSNPLVLPLPKLKATQRKGEAKGKENAKDREKEEIVRGVIKSYEDYDWPSLVVASDAPRFPLATTSNLSLRPRSGEELRTLEQNIERELRHSAQNIVSLPVSKAPNVVDCDFSPDMEMAQQMIVEQLLLLPSMQQPRFLRRLNSNKLSLPDEEASAEVPEEFALGGTITDDYALVKCLVSPSVVCAIDGDSSTTDNIRLPADALSVSVSPHPNLFDVAVPRWSMTQGSGSTSTGGRMSRASRHRGASPCGRQPTRPSSAFGLFRTPRRVPSAGYNQLSKSPSFSVGSRTSNFLTHVESPASDCPSVQSNANSWLMSASVDLSQQAKINAMTFQSALDRYMKVDDQSYFQDMVPVNLPLQREMQCIVDEEQKSDAQNKGDLVLLLMHIRCCDYVNMQDTISLPIVKVTSGSRVLARTSVMNNRVSPVWVIEMASFITFIRRSAKLFFFICDAEDERKIAYSAVMSGSDFSENGGVGLRIMPLLPEAHSNKVEDGDRNACLEVCMMAVTASKYNALQKQLTEETGEEALPEDSNSVYLQLLGVEGLKHRIEAVVVVSVECDGKTREILRTPHIAPKTRSPSWPGQNSFCVVTGDGTVSFDLYNRDELLASYDTPIDTLVFGGTGIHIFPLAQVQSERSGESYGEIAVSVLGTKTSGDESVTDRDAKVIAVHIGSFHMFQSPLEEFVPDPFVILRGPKGEVLRTPLSMGTYEAKWSEEDASCFILCPSLKGSVSVYYLEVYDNNEMNKIGEAEMIITTDGALHSRLQYPIQGKGVLTVYAHSLPVQELPCFEHKDELAPLTSPRVKEEDPFLLIHVSACDGLQGTGFDDFQIDPLVTIRFGRKRLLIAPLVSGSTAPRWTYPQATVIVPVCMDVLNHVTLEVWDTNIDLCDVLGVATVSLETLCQTGTHTFNLHPHKDQEFGLKQNLGSISLKTRFGSLNGEVVRPGTSKFFALEKSYSASLYDSRLFHTQGNSPDLPVTRVRLHVSNCSFIYADVPIRYMKVTVSCLQHVFLEAKKDVTKSCAAWAVDEAHAIIDLRAIYSRSILITVAYSTSSECKFSEIGTAIVPFSVLVSCVPDGVSVLSFPLCELPGVRREIAHNKPERSKTPNLNALTPSVTISLLATEAAQPESALK